MSLWPLRVFGDALWVKQFPSHISVLHEPCVQQTAEETLIVFFDDLLIYNKTWEEHLRHVDQILSIMEEQSLYAKESKCEFGMTKVLYLGHIIGEKGVQVHQEKITTIGNGLLRKHSQN